MNDCGEDFKVNSEEYEAADDGTDGEGFEDSQKAAAECVDASFCFPFGDGFEDVFDNHNEGAGVV